MRSHLTLSILIVLLFTTACQTPEPTPKTTHPTGEVVIQPEQPTATIPSAKTAPLDILPSPTQSTQPTDSAPIYPQDREFPEPGQYQWMQVAMGLERPVALTHAGDDTGRLFVIEQAGVIRIIQGNETLSTPFLDIRTLVGSRGNEQGLLGLAFHPDYRNNGHFFVNYTDLEGDTIIARFKVSANNPDLADPDSQMVLLNISQPYANHNGGAMAFGPDGYLYIGLGDGGSAGDPQNLAQSLQSLLGKILRLDVDNNQPYSSPAENSFDPNQLAEIWAYGLRNPWRFAFDRATGDLYIGDVGQNQLEEINYLPSEYPAGANFGWKYFEGSQPYSGETPASDIALIPPITEYSHSEGCSVTGGVIYRGRDLPEWDGIYLFSDFCTGWVKGLFRDEQGQWQEKSLFENLGLISSFGEDQAGEVYLVDLNGSIYKLTRNSQTANPTLVGTSLLNPTDLPSELESAPRYQIDLQINPAESEFDGISIVDFTNTKDVVLDRIFFRLIPNGNGSYGDGSLTVNNLLLDGKPATFILSQQDTVLEIVPDNPIKPNEKIQLSFDFLGEVPLSFGKTGSGYGIYNLSNGVMALSGWYPILAIYDEDGWNLDMPSAIGDSVYSDMAYYSVDLTVPRDQVVAATGVEVSRQLEGDQLNLIFESGPARDFFLIMSPDFSISSAEVDGTRINSYYLPGHAEEGDQALIIAADSLSAYNQNFGPYPYTELDVVEAPMQNAAGVEFPGIILVADFLYDNPTRRSFTIATAHEVAHQWWYNMVGNDVFDDPWLDEALTTYTSSLYYEMNNLISGQQLMILDWETTQNKLVDSGSNLPINLPLDYFESRSEPGLYGAVVYLKGALFFHKLRQQIGDPAFFTALKNYYRNFQYKIARPEDLLDEFEQAAGKSLDDFYQQWLYTSQP